MGRRGARRRHALGVCMFLRTDLGRRSGRKSEGECEGEREGERERERESQACRSTVPSCSAIAPCTPKYPVGRGDCRASHPPSRGRGGRCNVAWPAANGVRERGRGKRGPAKRASKRRPRDCVGWCRAVSALEIEQDNQSGQGSVSNKGLVHRVISSILYKRLYQYITDYATIPIHN